MGYLSNLNLVVIPFREDGKVLVIYQLYIGYLLPHGIALVRLIYFKAV
jgi:hypothetical protein